MEKQRKPAQPNVKTAFWDNEEPKIAATKQGTIGMFYYPKADILQVGRLAKNGHCYKGIALKLSELRESPEMGDLLREALENGSKKFLEPSN